MIDASWAAQNLGPMETAVPTEIAEVRPGDSGATVVGGVIFTLRPLKKKRRR